MEMIGRCYFVQPNQDSILLPNVSMSSKTEQIKTSLESCVCQDGVGSKISLVASQQLPILRSHEGTAFYLLYRRNDWQ